MKEQRHGVYQEVLVCRWCDGSGLDAGVDERGRQFGRPGERCRCCKGATKFVRMIEWKDGRPVKAGPWGFWRAAS